MSQFEFHHKTAHVTNCTLKLSIFLENDKIIKLVRRNLNKIITAMKKIRSNQQIGLMIILRELDENLRSTFINKNMTMIKKYTINIIQVMPEKS